MDRQNTSTWKRGAVIESRSPEGELEWHGKILSSEQPRRLVYTFEEVSAKEGASRVTFELKPLKKRGSGLLGNAVQLTVTHDQFPPGSKVYIGVRDGWPGILSSLKTLLEGGPSLDLVWKE